MSNDFEYAGGSVIGRDHVTLGRNNQDAHYVLQNDEVTVGVVCDGCGSSPYSEVGAYVGSRMAANALFNAFKQGWYNWPSESAKVLDWLQVMMAERLDGFAQTLGPTQTEQGTFSRSLTIQQSLLFTIVGFVISPDRTLILRMGDGIAAVNDVVYPLDPPAMPDGSPGLNTPMYLSYALVKTDLKSPPEFQVVFDGPTSDMQSLLIGTDGVKDLNGAAEKDVPGKAEKVGPLSQFWEDDRFFTNPDNVRRRLSILNRTSRRPRQDGSVDVQHGLLLDDTTMIVARRKAVENRVESDE